MHIEVPGYGKVAVHVQDKIMMNAKVLVRVQSSQVHFSK
jgi:hypothetical protein